MIACLLLFICQWSVVGGQASVVSNRGPRMTNKFAVIIGGVPGEPVYKKRFAGWTEDMYRLLRRQLDFAEDQIYYLTATPTDAMRPNMAKATAEAVRSTFSQLKTKAQPDSLIVVFLVGHGSFDGRRARFNLVGRDLTAEDFDNLLDRLPTRDIVLINTTSSSGPFIKALSQPGRIIMTATRSGREQNATRFAEFFIEAFEGNRADLDKNDRVSMLEAFTYASRTTAEWYEQQGRLATEHALLDDNGDKLGHGQATEGDGALAGTVYLDSRALMRAAGNPQLTTLIKKKEALERSIEMLKARKAELTEAAYEAELERLFVRLAQVNQEIKAAEGK